MSGLLNGEIGPVLQGSKPAGPVICAERMLRRLPGLLPRTIREDDETR